jgi:phage shock protein PspC (stress-responsive transcriptional regulator)
MNKTIIININGIIFHIEEDAYEVLKNYMTDVKRHFMNSADSLEITTDIENRIAEMFTDLLGHEGKQVIVEADVKQVIGQMGSVADFEHADEDTKGNFPPYATYHTERRRLFRDPDDHLISGVCAGIANYFDVNPAWIRLGFAVALFAGGSGALLYIILWIVVPKAITRADRMAMKGEKLDLQGFKRNFEEEISTVKGHLSNFQQEARPFVYNARDFFADLFHHLGVFLRGASKVFVKLIGVLILIGCFGALIGLFVAIISFLAFSNYGLYQVFPFSIVNHQVDSIFLVSAFLFLALPLLTIILVTISAIFSGIAMGKATGSTLFCVWLAAICCVVYYGIKVSADFRFNESFTQNINIKPTANNTYYLKVNDIKYLTGEDSIRYRIKERFHGNITISDDDDNNDTNNWPGSVNIDIEKSDVARPVLVERFSAKGHDFDDALTNARNTFYQFTQQDSVLKFNRRLEKPLNRLWRDQALHLTLKVPLNAKLVIDQELDRYLNGGAEVYNCKELNKQDKATSAVFVMTDNGLQCKVDTVSATDSLQKLLRMDSIKKKVRP